MRIGITQRLQHAAARRICGINDGSESAAFFQSALVSSTRPPMGDFRVDEWHAKHFAARTGRILVSKRAVSGDCALREAHQRAKMKYRVILPCHPRLLPSLTFARGWRAKPATVSAMRALSVLVLCLCCPAFAQFDLFTCASITKAYVVGAKLPASGLFFKSKAGGWEHAGLISFIMALDYDERGALYLAGGNGMIRASDGGRSWRILTGSEVTNCGTSPLDPPCAGHACTFRALHGRNPRQPRWRGELVGRR